MKTLSNCVDKVGSFSRRMLKRNIYYAVFMFSTIGIMVGMWEILGFEWALACAFVFIFVLLSALAPVRQ